MGRLWIVFWRKSCCSLFASEFLLLLFGFYLAIFIVMRFCGPYYCYGWPLPTLQCHHLASFHSFSDSDATSSLHSRNLIQCSVSNWICWKQRVKKNKLKFLSYFSSHSFTYFLLVRKYPLATKKLKDNPKCPTMAATDSRVLPNLIEQWQQMCFLHFFLDHISNGTQLTKS